MPVSLISGSKRSPWNVTFADCWFYCSQLTGISLSSDLTLKWYSNNGRIILPWASIVSDSLNQPRLFNGIRRNWLTNLYPKPKIKWQRYDIKTLLLLLGVLRAQYCESFIYFLLARTWHLTIELPATQDNVTRIWCHCNVTACSIKLL